MNPDFLLSSSINTFIRRTSDTFIAPNLTDLQSPFKLKLLLLADFDVFQSLNTDGSKASVAVAVAAV